MTNLILQILTVAIVAYIIGSIPTGYLIVKAKTGEDIRKVGSGSTGATNVKRVLGKKWFFIVMISDALKGAVPVIMAKVFGTVAVGIGLLPVVAAVAVIVGHSKSCFLGFKGGKSVAKFQDSARIGAENNYNVQISDHDLQPCRRNHT